VRVQSISNIAEALDAPLRDFITMYYQWRVSLAPFKVRLLVPVSKVTLGAGRLGQCSLEKAEILANEGIAALDLNEGNRCQL